MNTYDVVVVGSGFAGSVFAREMAESNKKVLILEKRPHIGGNMYDEYSIENINIHKYGPHIFHTNNKKVFNYLERFSNWYEYKHRVMGRIDGEFVPIPFNFTSIDILFPNEKGKKLKKILTEYFGENNRVFIFDLINHHNNTIHEFGEFVFNKVYQNYTIKQWGIPIQEVDKSVFSRIPIITGYDNRYFTDLIQRMPCYGFRSLFSSMLTHKNIHIRLNTDASVVLSLDFSTRKVLFEGRDFPGTVLFTGPIDQFLNYKFGPLPYRSLHFVFENVKSSYYQPCAVVNYPNSELYTRITEFKYFDQEAKHNDMISSNTVILKEYPISYEIFNENEPYYPVTNEKNNILYRKYIESTSIFKNLFLCGRLAEYKYFNMDLVIANSLSLAEKLK
jgi:UDP-galactopyranose mutase